jgi:hypothetical protein
MKRLSGIGVLLIAAFGAPAASADLADLTQYKIEFTGTGVMPTAASFTYDPDTATFSSFLVTWDSLSFDLTNAANTLSFGPNPPPSCFAGLSGGAASFVLITKGCSTPQSQIFWFGDTEVDRSARFEFVDSDPEPPGPPSTSLDAVLLSGPAVHDTGSGGWVTTELTVPPAVPEPASLVLLATVLGLAGVVALSRSRAAR